jgi:hypothetical protein
VIPTTLAGWTLDVVRGLVEQGVFETDRFDFKERLPHANDDKDKRRLRWVATSFANSDGGFLIFGVKDDKTLATAQRLVGLPASLDLPVQFGNLVSASQPTIDWDFLNPPLALAGAFVIHIVHVATSRRKPHAVLEDDAWRFVKRTNKGTEVMSYAEIQTAFGSRREKLARLRFVRTEVERVQRLAAEINARAHQSRQSGWHGSIPSYDFGAATGLLPEIFEFIGDDAETVGAIQNLRRLITEAEEARTLTSNERGLAHLLATSSPQLVFAAERAVACLVHVEQRA